MGAIEISKVSIKGFNPQLVEVYGSTLDPSDLSLPLPVFQAKGIEFPCTCIRAVSSPPIAVVPTIHYSPSPPPHTWRRIPVP